MKKIITFLFILFILFGCNQTQNEFKLNHHAGTTFITLNQDSTVFMRASWSDQEHTSKWKGSYAYGDTLFIRNEYFGWDPFRSIGDELIVMKDCKTFELIIDSKPVVYTFYNDTLYTIEFKHPNGGKVINTGRWSGGNDEGDTLTVHTNNDWEMQWEVIGNQMFPIY